MMNFLLLMLALAGSPQSDSLKTGFRNPPPSARPGVYWYFMDGNQSKASMTADLESMQRAGIGYVVFLEVNVGIPRGPVDFLSEQWQELFTHAMRESERLNIAVTLGVGPGWSGSGGPWVQPGQSMQHLVASSINVSGAYQQKIQLPVPPPRKPFFGEGGLTPAMKKQWNDFYEDVAVLAFPAPATAQKITGVDEKALYYRAPYSSAPNVKQYLPAPDTARQPTGIRKNQIVNLTGKLRPDGTLHWKVPPGNWTIMRFGVRNNGAVTRPAPFPGLGFEADKLDTVAMNAHLDAYVGKLLRRIGPPDPAKPGGLKTLHMDSWEMGAQNWTPGFRKIFAQRRGYDPLPFFPVYAGHIVENPAISERFLWDLRLTLQELVIANHAQHLKKYSHRNGLQLSIEPYDMNPTADLELGAVADIPMCEFWSKGFGFNTSFSCIEAVSIAHVNGIPLVPAEAFTAQNKESWQQYPGSMKEQGDWAFAAGINRLVYHTFINQALNDSLRPGMTMGPYGVHWDRGQTWWPMADGYHRYISRCQYILQQGRTVADILYLSPEGAPHVFRPPASALEGDAVLPDRKGYNFDGCAPGQLYAAKVEQGNIVFPGGASYRLLVLPDAGVMSAALLEKIRALIHDGATIIGPPPTRAPGLSGYPAVDAKVRSTAKTIWGGLNTPIRQTIRPYGKGKIIWGGNLSPAENLLYPDYAATAAILQETGLMEDFTSAGPVRCTHRTMPGRDIYFVANRTDQPLQTDCIFRTTQGAPSLWDPLTGDIRPLPEFNTANGQTTIPMKFAPYQSFFVVFEKSPALANGPSLNFPESEVAATLGSPWAVSFNPRWGGPATITFDQLEDWTQRREAGIKYYSGIAVYKQQFNMPDMTAPRKVYLDLGAVKHMARVRLNGQDLGVVWTAPWSVDITAALRPGSNQVEIEVANLWPNRLIGDASLPDDGVKNGQWPAWLLEGKPRTSGRYAFATRNPYKKDSPLLPSGLMGPVTIQYEK
ncbi:glycosyl hydrolase [Chitinophaga alhagiae]|uniref:Glycosyl hydrolase n=1 Tax=Chitinophaga alhagiae TaxID=2203219 RepID=A0ABM6WDH5_9BACT|nr:glycosyl hydrolase [Chitinophaga alhagiae]AWO01984.1 glycosyl hydrolase [Chitinophaga alhagiae]